MLRVLPIALAVAAIAVSGCGSDVKARNDYVDAVNKAQNGFATSFARLSRRITSTSTPAQDQRTLNGFKRAVDRAVTQLRAIEVPESVKGQHAQLVNEIAAYGREIDKAKKAFRSSSPQDVIKAQTQLVSAVTRVSAQINHTIDQINTKLRE
jgi:hypothetical protein